MIAFDTNLLVRLATNDSPEEREVAIALLDRERVLIPMTVLLECEWVLRSRYGYTPTDFCQFVSFISGLGTATIEKGELVLAALKAHELGCDFADALHAHNSAPAPLYSLDQQLVKKGKKLGLNVVLAKNPN